MAHEPVTVSSLLGWLGANGFAHALSRDVRQTPSVSRSATVVRPEYRQDPANYMGRVSLELPERNAATIPCARNLPQQPQGKANRP